MKFKALISVGEKRHLECCARISPGHCLSNTGSKRIWLTTELAVQQVGCGPGNTAYPLLQSNPAMHVWACDTSEEAVKLFRAHPSDAKHRTKAWVADISSDDLQEHAAPASMDFCTMVFVLSAIPQSSQLKVGGHTTLPSMPAGSVNLASHCEVLLLGARLSASLSASGSTLDVNSTVSCE